MDEQKFKEELTSLLEEPPDARAGEFSRIVARIEKRKRLVWQFGLVPASLFALLIVLFVQPKEAPKEPKNFFSVAEDISIGF